MHAPLCSFLRVSVTLWQELLTRFHSLFQNVVQCKRIRHSEQGCRTQAERTTLGVRREASVGSIVAAIVSARCGPDGIFAA